MSVVGLDQNRLANTLRDSGLVPDGELQRGLNGRLLVQGKGQSTGQLEQFELNLSPFSDGIYLLRLQTPDGMRTLKVTKM